MPFLIAVYVVLGLFNLAAALFVAFGIVRGLLGSAGGRNLDALPEMVAILAVMLVIASLPLLVAYGLWRRWRVVRLLLIVMSWWTIAVSAFGAAVALAMSAGWTDG